MIKKIIVFLPLLILIMVFLGIFIIFGSLPSGYEFYLYLLANLIAGLCLIKENKLGIIIGVLFGLYLCGISRFNWKLGVIEFYSGILYILMYLVIYILFFRSKKRV